MISWGTLIISFPPANVPFRRSLSDFNLSKVFTIWLLDDLFWFIDVLESENHFDFCYEPTTDQCFIPKIIFRFLHSHDEGFHKFDF